MTKLFGTDGVRGVANRDLTPDLALLLGRAAGLVLASPGREVIIGRDTRVSGPMLEGALAAGLASAGCDVARAGVVPTPTVAFLTIARSAAAGGMVSASHNPVPDNGIKFFSADGFKIASELEAAIETLVRSGARELPTGVDVGSMTDLPDAGDRYLEHLLGSLPDSLEGTKVVLDCAYGSAFDLAPRAFREAGAEVISIHDEPDGTRINVDCGSTSLTTLSERVVAEGADLGLAFDGDADRVLACDERGGTVDGDQLMALFALDLLHRGVLKNEVVVATVMANLGFARVLQDRGIEVVRAQVGDRFVMEEMISNGAVLGGEQSGHIIFAEHATTGDGILAALQLARIVSSEDRPLSQVANLFERAPQILINVNVKDRNGLESVEGLWAEVRRAEQELGDDGRVLLRPSGTEPVVRVMVEASDRKVAERIADALATSVRTHLG